MKASVLQEIMALNLTAEQLAGVVSILARELAPLESLRASVATRSARYRALGGGDISDDLRRSVYERDGFACVYCGSEQNLSCDHVIPVSKGGATTFENLATACRPCNSRKKDKERKQFVRSMDKLRTNSGHSAETGRNSDGLARVEYNNNLPNLEGSKINPLVPPSTSKPKPSEPDGFGEFFEVYPKRDGNADRKGAAKAFGAALKRTTLKTLLDGARGYAEHCKAKGKVQTEYVKQARSWLNGDLWTEWAPKAATTQSQAVEQRVPVIEDSPAWQEWKAIKPSLTARDIWLQDGKRARGWYFPTEFPKVSAGAMQ